MVLFDELKALLDLVNGLSDRRRETEEQKNLNAILVAVHELGSEGSRSIDQGQLETAGFSKMQVLRATTQATDAGWLKRAATFGNANQWYLTLDGTQYVEAVLEELGRR